MLGTGVALAMWLAGFEPPTPLLIANATLNFVIFLSCIYDQWRAVHPGSLPPAGLVILILGVPLLNAVVQAVMSCREQAYASWMLPACTMGLAGFLWLIS